MRDIHQFVYGRVTRGLRPGGGYQPAAISPGIEGDAALQEQLQKLSYYPHGRSRKAQRPRYGFCCVDQRWLSLSRTSLAKDLDGNVGFFSHHLVVGVDDVFRDGSLPFRLLREHAFYTREADLPNDRVLDTLAIPKDRAEAPRRDSPGFATMLRVARALCRSTHVPVPALITGQKSDEDVLRFVENVLSLYPLRVAVNLSFCSSFEDSSENLPFYRFVSVSSEEDLPEPVESFECIPSDDARRQPAPYVDWLESAAVEPSDAQNLLILCAGHHAAIDEARRREALEDPRLDALPAVLEKQWPNWARDYLVEHPKLFGSYYDRVPSWDVRGLAGEFARRPRSVADSLLALRRHPEARPCLLKWVIDGLLSGRGSVDLLRWADGAGLVGELARRTADLTPEQMVLVAGAVGEADLEDPALHRMLARSALEGDRSIESTERLARWVLRPANHRHCPGLASLIMVLGSLLRNRPPDEPLDFASIAPDDYRLFARRLAESFRARVPNPEVLRHALSPHDRDTSLRIALGAFRCRPAVEFLVLAERELAPDARQRGRIVATLSETKNRSAAHRYREWLDKQEISLTDEQKQQMESLMSSRLSQFFRDFLPRRGTGE